jgi:hypothetical protein
MKSSSMLTGPNTSLLTFPMILLKDKPWFITLSMKPKKSALSLTTKNKSKILLLSRLLHFLNLLLTVRLNLLLSS